MGAPTVRLDLHEVPKPGGGVRVVTSLDRATALEYRHAVAAIALARTGAFGIRTSGVGLAAERTAWQRAVEAAAASGVTVRSDVRTCYPSIGLDAVGIASAAAGSSRSDIVRLQDVLHRIQRAGSHGLPVGPPASAVVADSVMSIADRAVVATGGTVVRWVDDVVIAGPTRARALSAFDAWAACLRSLGLEAHEGKTAVVDGPLSFPRTSGSGMGGRGMMRPP